MLFVITNIFWVLHQSASSGALGHTLTIKLKARLMTTIAWQYSNKLETFTFCKSEKIIKIHEAAKPLLDNEIITARSISLPA